MGRLSLSPVLHGTLRWRGSLGLISLFTIVGNSGLRTCDIGSSSSANAPWVVRSREFPCIFLGNQGFHWRDEFATDWFLRQPFHGPPGSCAVA